MSERSEVFVLREITLGSKVSGSADSSGSGFSCAGDRVLLDSAGLREGQLSESPVFISNEKSTSSMQRCSKIRRHNISGAWDAERSGAHAPPFSDRAAKYIFRFSLAAFAVLVLLMCAFTVPAAAVSVVLSGDAGAGYVLTAVDSSAAESFDVSWMVSSNGADWVSALNCSNSSEFLLSSSEFENLTGAMSGFVCACSGTGDALVYSEPTEVSFVPQEMNGSESLYSDSDVVVSDVSDCAASEPTESTEPEAPKDDDLPKPDMSQTLPVPELVERTNSTVTSDGHRVTVSGLMPADVFVRAIPLEQDLVDEILRVYFNLSAGSPVPESFFAYDITLVNGTGAVFQPEEFGVSVSVSRIEKLAEEMPKPEAVEVVHVNTTSISPDAPDEGKAEVKMSDVDLSALNETVMSSVQVDSVDTGSVEFTADSFSWFIGTIGSGATLEFADGIGYSFKKSDGAELSGRQEVNGGSFSFKVVPEPNFAVWQVFQTPEGGTKTELIPNNDGLYTIQSVSANTLVSVVSAVNSTGGTITTVSSSADVAQIFDATTALGTSNNVVVTGGSGTYTVTLNNNILLKGCINVSSGVNLKILSAGDYTIKRSSELNKDHMFNVSGTLEFGSGSLSDDTITYTFQNGTTTTAPVATVLPEDDLKNVSSTNVNAVVTNTMTGTLTIDSGAVLSGGIFAKKSENPKNDGVRVTGQKDIVIVMQGAVMKMWGGVTIRNHYCSDANDGKGSPIYVHKGTFYMYDGLITRCVLDIKETGSNTSDGGGFGVNGEGAKAYMYGGRIAECGANAYGGFAVFRGASATVLGGVVENCYSKGAGSQYGGAAAVGIFSEDTNTKLYFFGGEIARNTQSSGWWNESGATEGICQYDLKQNSGSTSYFFSGTVGVMNAFKGKLSIYRCVVDSISENPGKGTVEYIGQTYAVTLPDVVRTDRTLPVTLTASRGDTQVHTITTSGIGSRDVSIYVANGTYRIDAVSDSMKKVYSVTVNGANIVAGNESRTMTVPVLASKTTTSVSIKEAGTGAALEGVIYYGYSSTDNSVNVVDWYYIESGTVKLNSASVSDSSVTYADQTITFNYISGAKYFFIKAGSTSIFSESISSGLLVSTSSVSGVTITPSAITLAAGNSYTFIATVQGDNNPSQEVSWTFEGAKSPETKMNDGHLYLGATESAGTITIKATSVINSSINAIATVTVGASGSSSNIATLVYVDCYVNSELRRTVSTFNQGDQNGYNYAAISAVDKSDGYSITISPQPSVTGAECKIYWATQNYVDDTTSFDESDATHFKPESGAHNSVASIEYCFIVVTALDGTTKSVYRLAVCKLGDVNSDNKIDIADSACIGIYILKGSSGFLNEYQSAAADINCKSGVDSTDILLLNRYLVGDYNIGESVVP